jgi:hypothetical protein
MIFARSCCSPMHCLISLRDVHNAIDVPGIDFRYLESTYNFGHMN